MKTEKETIREILVNWGVIKDGVFIRAQFDKKVVAGWLRKKVLSYGFDKEGAVKKAVEAAPAEPVVENVCAKCGKNPCECEAEPVKPVEPIVEAPVEEAPVEEAPAEAPVEAPEAVVETVEEAPVEEAPAEEVPAEETKTTKKKSSKKK